MLNMFLDKHGSTSVLSAFEAVVKEKLPINLTCSVGMVENSINENAYRPSDIIKSRKGLTVEIGNTDAEGRLVLCDCMHWTQENFKVDCMIEESTLTGAMIIALGASHAGIFSNNKDLVDSLTKAGSQVNELVWHLPLTDYNRDMMKGEKADLNSMGQRPESGSAQAAAYLESFVEEGVRWVHMDIAGTAIVGNEGSGYGARILVQFARNYTGK
jgi:leucyl aminopeptidase